MKKFLRNKLAIILVVRIAKLYVWLLFKLCRLEVRMHPEAREIIDQKHTALFCYWHGRILVFPKFMTGLGKFGAVISAHGDGEFISQAIISYGHKTTRGSSRKNSIQALMGIIRLIKQRVSVGITPDGPKGPRFKIKGAIGELALKYDLPVVPMTYSASNAAIVNSWDRFILPIPIRSRIIIEIGKPIKVGKASANPNKIIEKAMLKQTMILDKELKLLVDYK